MVDDKRELELFEIPDGEVKGTDLQRLVLVGDDLDYLIGLPGDRLLTHAEVRASANVLRRLLIDGQVSQLLKALAPPKGLDPVVEATFIDPMLRDIRPEWVRVAWAGGAPSEGAQHKGFALYSIPEAVWRPYGSMEKFHEQAGLSAPPPVTHLTLSEWLASTSVAIGTDGGLVVISRREVIQYNANKAGGVHFDPSRRIDLALKGGAKRDRKREKEVKYKLLDYAFVRVGHLSGPEYEIASMAHVIAQSEWAQTISRMAREAAPEDFNGDPNELKVWDGSEWATFTFGDPGRGN